MNNQCAHIKARRIDRMCILVMTLCNQREAFASDLGDDQSYLCCEKCESVIVLHTDQWTGQFVINQWLLRCVFTASDVLCDLWQCLQQIDAHLWSLLCEKIWQLHMSNAFYESELTDRKQRNCLEVFLCRTNGIRSHSWQGKTGAFKLGEGENRMERVNPLKCRGFNWLHFAIEI